MNDSRELIIALLGKKWPLGAKEIWTAIKRERAMTYQAAHKLIKKMFDEGVLVKKDSKYMLNLLYVVKARRNWETIEESYKTYSTRGGELITPQSLYLFEKDSVIVNAIPSVFISKSTLQEMVETLPKKELDRIAKNIAMKDHQFIQQKLPKEIRPTSLIYLEKLNELANEFYWGKVTYTEKGKSIEIKIESGVYTSPKAKYFYEGLYTHFMKLLGYRVTKRNILQNTYTYEAEK